MMGARMLGRLQVLTLRRLSVSQRFALLSFFCVLAITVLVCAASSAVLRRQLVEQRRGRHRRSGLPPVHLERFLPNFCGAVRRATRRCRAAPEFARSELVVRFMVYDADGWVLWSDDVSLTDHHFGKNTKGRRRIARRNDRGDQPSGSGRASPDSPRIFPA